MDIAGEELGRIVAFVNRRPWIMEDTSACLRYVGHAIGCTASSSLFVEQQPRVRSNYMLDRLGKTSCGDSSLHRLCAWHPTPEQFQAFLDHIQAHQFSRSQRQSDNNDSAMEDITSSLSFCSCELDNSGGYLSMPEPPRLDQTNHKGVTALHVAVYRNAFHAHEIVKKLLQQQPSLASTPMTCGSYPLHILCGHNVTIRKEVLAALVEADPSVVFKEDVHGDTPLSCLWKNVLRFRWAQQENISLGGEADDDVSMSGDNSLPANRQRRRPSWMTVISPDQYVEYSLLLIRAALGIRHLRLVDVCKMPRCPLLLIQLILQNYNELTCNQDLAPDTVREIDAMGMTPLHHAAHVNAVNMLFVPSHVQAKTKSVVDLLLESFPSMEGVRDKRGRIALHYALEKNFPSNNDAEQEEAEALHRFVQANPDSRSAKDPVTGLYPFALLAARTSQQHEQQCEDNMDVELKKSPQRDLAHLDTIFWLLRHFPEAAIYRE